MPTREIKLGDKTFTLTLPLTLGQLIDAHVGMALAASTDTQEEVRRSYKRVIDVIIAAAKPDHPDITADQLLAIRGVSIQEFNKAARVALEESGLSPRAEAEPAGEAQAEAA